MDGGRVDDFHLGTGKMFKHKPRYSATPTKSMPVPVGISTTRTKPVNRAKKAIPNHNLNEIE